MVYIAPRRGFDMTRAANGNEELRQVLEALVYVPLPSTPPSCSFAVGGQDGTFVIDITNPDQQPGMTIGLAARRAGLPDYAGVSIAHQLQCSRNRLFDAAGEVRTYGPDVRVHWEITNLPDESRYWRLRSSFDGGQSWNAWRDFRDPLLCGVVPVWSGLVRSVRQMPNTVINTTNYAVVSSVPEGSLAAIVVNGGGGVGTPWLRKVGVETRGPYPAATLHGYLQHTYYRVYWDVQYRLYRVFTRAQFVDTLNDRFVYAGEVQTASSGGADAAAAAVVSGGAVVAVNLTNGGSGYLQPPQVQFTPVAGGAGALAVATLTGGVVTGITVVSGGSGYGSAPTVTLVGGRTADSGGGGDEGGPGGSPYYGGHLFGL